MCCALLWTAVSAEAASPEVTQVPDADFLEFLGNWHTADGRWVDPFHAAELSGAETVIPPQKDRRSGPTQEPPRTNRRESREGSDQQGTPPIDPMREMK